MRKYFVFLTLLVATAVCADPETGWYVLGRGSESCGSYSLALTADRPDQLMSWQGRQFPTTAYMYAQWITGFVTYANTTRKLPQQIVIDVNGVALWVKNYCDAHPDEQIVKAAIAYVNTHPAKKQ